MRKHGPGRVIYLVPSAQAVRDTERDLLLTGDSRGLLGSVVMDFVGLAFRILKEAGCFPLRRIGPLDKSYLILRIIRETPLRFFENVKDYDGFAQVVGDFIAELKRGMISPEEFLNGCLLAAGQRSIAKDKILGLHAIYSAYQNALKDSGAYDGDGLQWMAAEVLVANRSLLSSVEVLIVDGFATYTPVEMQMLTLLVERIGESHLTLCHERDGPDVFGFVRRTYRRLSKLCEGKETVLGGNHLGSAELLHLERNLFGEGENQISAGAAISIIPCTDVYDEVETVARQIERVRSEEKLEYCDFMVIVRDVGEYRRPISEVFSERQIPFSIPGAAYLAEDPFIRSAVSTLRLVEGEFRSEGVITALKNSYINADRDIAAAIENYVDEFGLGDQEQFRQTWTRSSEAVQDVGLLNSQKARFVEALDRLRSEADNVSSAEQFRDFVFATIRKMGFLNRGGDSAGGEDRTLRRRSETTVPFSSEYRSLGALASLLDDMCEYARLVELPNADYAFFLEMLERGLSSEQMPSASRNQNSVRVTSIVGGLPRPAPVVFVCGLCERSFPREIANEPLFKDRERRLINRRGKIALDERLPLSSGERFFFYTAVTRATKRLILTYPATDSAGDELAPSHYIEEVARLFSDLGHSIRTESPGMRVLAEFGDIADAAVLRFFVANQLSQKCGEEDEGHDESQTLATLAYNELIETSDLHTNHLIYQPPGRHEALPVEVCQALKKDTYPTSVSELETFARCPFRHLCEYTLQLKVPPRYEFTHREEGILYHEVLARLYREIYLTAGAEKAGGDASACRQRRAIEGIPEDELSSRLSALVNEFINAGYARLFQAPRMEVRRRAIETRIKDFLLKEVENERANATRPAYFELSFGKGKGKQDADDRSTSKALSLGMEGAPLVQISGRMDRVDIFEKDRERFAIILDYKRSGQRTKPDLRQGTILQVGLYMLALKELFNMKPAGAFYYSISSGRKRGVFAAEEEERISGQGDVSRTDKVSYDEIGDLIELNAAQAVEYVTRIQSGDIGVRPADPNHCRTCPFGTLCRIADPSHVLQGADLFRERSLGKRTSDSAPGSNTPGSLISA